MKSTDFLPFAKQMLRHGVPFLVEGPPGSAKTSLLELAAQELGYDCIKFLLSTKSPIDLGGLPAQVKAAAGKSPAEWDFVPIGDLRRVVNAKKDTVLILDDLAQGTISAQNAASHLLLARQVGEQSVSNKVRMCATTNTREHNSGANPVLENVKSRFGTIVTLDEDVDGWLGWAQMCEDVGLLSGPVQFPPIVVAFIAWKRDMLYGFQPLPGLENSNTPRTVHNMAKCLAAEAVTERIAYEVFKGAAGKPITIEFLAFLKLWAHLPDPADVLADPDILDGKMYDKYVWHEDDDPTKSGVKCIGQSPITQRPDIQYALTTSVSDIMLPGHMEKFLYMLEKFGSKPLESLGMLLAKRKGNAYLETPAFTAWAVKNQAMFTPD